MANRDVLLFIGFLRSGKMFPAALPTRDLSPHRSLRFAHEAMDEQERALFGKRKGPVDDRDIRRRAALASWSGELLGVGTRVEEIPDPGVLLCLLYDVPLSEAPLPLEVCAQTLRRYALRDPDFRVRFDAHVDEAGTFVPTWLSPEVRRKRSQEAFDAAMKVAREKGFAHAAPLFEGVRGVCHAQAQVALAVHEARELGDAPAALGRLNEVLRLEPRNIAARMQRARLLRRDASRSVEAATDYLVVLREVMASDAPEAQRSLREAATTGLWALHREYADPARLDAARARAASDAEQGFDALSRYVHTHPSAWDAQVDLAALAVRLGRHEAATKLLGTVRWLFPEDARPHLIYAQALASTGHNQAALAALEVARALRPSHPEVKRWIDFARERAASEREGARSARGVSLTEHAARTLLVLTASIGRGRLLPSLIPLRKLPGDVPLAIVVQAVARKDRRRRFAESISGEYEVRAAAERCVMTGYQGEPLGIDQTVADAPDPGVVVALLYDKLQRDDFGRPAPDPRPEACRAALLDLARRDSEMSAKLERHLASDDATLKARLGNDDPDDDRWETWA